MASTSASAPAARRPAHGSDKDDDALGGTMRSPSASYRRQGPGRDVGGYCHGRTPSTVDVKTRARAQAQAAAKAPTTHSGGGATSGVDSDDEAFVKSLYSRYSSVRVPGDTSEPRALGQSRVLPREFGAAPARSMLLSVSPHGRRGGAVPRTYSRKEIAEKFIKSGHDSAWEWNGDVHPARGADIHNAMPVQGKGPHAPGSEGDMAQWIRVLHRRLEDRDRQLMYVRDVYTRDVVRVKEAVFQKKHLPDSKLTDVNTSALVHEFLRVFFGKTNMAILKKSEVERLQALQPGFKRMEAQLEMTAKEASKLAQRHSDLSESATEVAHRCGEAERLLKVEQDNADALRELLRQSEEARDKQRLDLERATATIADLTSNGMSIPALLIKSTQQAEKLATALENTSTEALHVAAHGEMLRFKGLLTALEGWDDTVGWWGVS